MLEITHTESNLNPDLNLTVSNLEPIDRVNRLGKKKASNKNATSNEKRTKETDKNHKNRHRKRLGEFETLLNKR